jgi:hypothetical protein
MRRDLIAPIAVGLTVAALGTVAAMAGLRANHQPDTDPRLTTYGTGPAGARGFADAMERLGAPVLRLRTFPGTGIDSSAVRPLAILDPSRPLSTGEGIALARQVEVRDLLLVGDGAEPVMRCFGYRLTWTDNRRVRVPGPPPDSLTVWKVLVPDSAATVRDRSSGTDRVERSCTVPAITAVDTLLATIDGHPVLLRLHVDDRVVMLAADGAMLNNRRLRRPAIGVAMLTPIRRTFSALAIDEFHHGFSTGKATSPGRAVLAWSLTSPWGWAGWQLAAVGLVSLIAGGVRFGPLELMVRANRRSPLEHVRALATAFAAARGHGEGVRWIVRGLRRRLGRITPGVDDAVWLGRAGDTVRTARGRAAIDTLQNALRDPTADAPRAAAAAADTLWEEWHS